MKSNITANVRMVQKYDSDQAKGINVFCEEENEGLNDNLLGPVQLVLGGPLEMFAGLSSLYKDGLLPGPLDMVVDIGRGADGKAKLTSLSYKDPSLQAHLNNATVDTTTGEIKGNQNPGPADPTKLTNPASTGKPNVAQTNKTGA